MELRRRSRALVERAARAGARAQLKSRGHDDDALAKPFVGVPHRWTETVPCNVTHRMLAVAVKAGVRTNGGTPMAVDTVAISGGITMGTAGTGATTDPALPPPRGV